MKLIAGVTVMLFLTAAGIIKGREMTDCVRMLEGIIMFLADCKSMIEYTGITVGEILENTSCGTFEAYTEKCRRYASELDFPEAWKKSVGEIPPFISKSDRELLVRFGEKIGTSDKDTQLNMLSYLISRFEISLREKREREKKEKKLYIFAGTALGLVAFIMII